MKRFLAVSGAVLRKDCRHLWPQAAPTAVVAALSNISFDQPVADGLLRLAALLVCAFLVVRLIQDDSAVSVEPDWLTRPIAAPVLLVAKVAFVILWIMLPSYLGATLLGLYQGYSLAESLLAAVLLGGIGAFSLLPFVLAAVFTAKLRQTMLVLLASGVLFIAASIYLERSIEMPAQGDTLYAAHVGTSWMLQAAWQTLAIAAFLTIVWRQYGPRKTAQARMIYAALALLLMGAVLVLKPVARSIVWQQQLGPGPAAASALDIELVPGCFTTSLATRAASVNSLGATWDLKIPEALMSEARPNSLVFQTQLELPEPEDRVLVAHPTARYVSADGSALFTVPLVPAGPQFNLTRDGKPATTHFWFLPRERYEELAAVADVRLQIDYALSLLEPSAQLEVASDGPRRFQSGLGYCGARQLDRGSIKVDCFKPGPQPAWLAFRVAGESLGAARSDVELDFKPPALGMLDGKRYQPALRVAASGSPQVRITAYQVRAHFNRQVTAPGILGGSKEACPAPEARQPVL